jgi:hypothetical protein
MSPCRLALAVVLVAPVASAWAQGSSPFMPPAAVAPAAAPAGGPLEYGGFVTTAEGKLFRIVGDKSGRKTGVYLRLGEKDANLGVTLRGYNAANQSVTVEYQGQTLTLEERKSKIVSSGNPAAMMAPVPAPTAPAAAPAAPPVVAPAVTQSVVVNPTAADEQRRLEAVAAEVARRRAMREQAQQQSQPGTAPGSVPSPAGPARQQP